MRTSPLLLVAAAIFATSAFAGNNQTGETNDATLGAIENVKGDTTPKSVASIMGYTGEIPTKGPATVTMTKTSMTSDPGSYPSFSSLIETRYTTTVTLTIVDGKITGIVGTSDVAQKKTNSPLGKMFGGVDTGYVDKGTAVFMSEAFSPAAQTQVTNLTAAAKAKGPAAPKSLIPTDTTSTSQPPAGTIAVNTSQEQQVVSPSAP